MFAMKYITLSCILLQMAYSLSIRSDITSSKSSNALRRVLDSAGGSGMFVANGEDLPQPSMYDLLANQLQAEEYKTNKKYRHKLRSAVTGAPFSPVVVNTEHAELVEKELKDTESKNSAMLYEQAYVEKAGMNDFLVFKNKREDPFVTIIPNDIYYDPGAKICVNWLDECSIQGIRARLLHRVRSP